MTATTQLGAMRIMKKALQRIGEYHSTEGAIARIALMDATGVHPWKTDRVSQARFEEHVELERRLARALK